jgi:peptidoglycan/xylan/chitin deacetylase (PgdA/CDA1 family)
MLKHYLRTLASRPWPEQIAPRVVFYHSVHPAQDLSIKPALFAEHVDWLLANGFQILTFSQLTKRVQAGDGASKLVCITFDDGYADNYEYAVPILMHRQIQATFFVVTGLMSDSAPLSSNDGNYLYSDREMLTKSQLSEMHTCGLEIGSHTRSHVHVKKTLQQSELVLIDELVGSRKDLEDCLGVSVTCFAYPYGQKGFFDANTARYVRAAGYQYAATTIWGRVTPLTNPLEIPRMEIKFDDSIDDFKQKIMGRHDYMRYYELAFDRSAKWKR